MITPIRISIVLCLLLAVLGMPVIGQTTIYVAPKDTPAYANAQSLEDGQQKFAERTFHRALTNAAEILNQPGEQNVVIAVAAGSFKGKAKQGVWVLPQITNPDASLYILGGFSDDFRSRQPFTNLSALVTAEGRNGAFLQITKRSQIKKMVISGLILFIV